MTIRVGKIPYLNSVLFYHGLEHARDIALSPLVPRQLSGAAVEDAVDAGPVPLVTCWDLEGHFEPLDDFCIATVDRARSILFYSKRPFSELNGASIGITNETSTSVRLLKVLLENVYKVRPARFGHLDWPNNDAFLLIGDEALIHRRGVKGYSHVADLGHVWQEWTGLPFVFARWMVRRGCDAVVRDRLVAALTSSLDSGWNNFDAVVEPRTHDLSMTTAEMREYLEGFHFRMTPAEHTAASRFRELDSALRSATTETT